MRRSAITLSVMLAAGGAGAIELGPPVDCVVGEDCFVQNYVDLDPGPGFKDYLCGGAGYDGHKGVDFAVRGGAEMAAGVAVIAAAAGVVKGVRDGEPDDGVERPGKTCGNGLVVDHGDGWETQYCHLRQGSLAVRPGQQIGLGDKVGLIGQSGRAQFPHVHLSLRKDGETVDPFRGLNGGPTCGLGATPLWAGDLAETYGFEPAWLNYLGFAPAPPDWDAIGAGRSPAPNASTPLVAYVDLRGVPKDWRVDIALIAPNGETLAANNATADRHKARYTLFAGKKAPQGGWPSGRYQGRVEIRSPDGRTRTEEAVIGLGS